MQGQTCANVYLFSLNTLFGLGDDGSNDAGTIGEVVDDTHVRKACLTTELGRGVERALSGLARLLAGNEGELVYRQVRELR